MARRGFLATLMHEAQVAARERERAERAAVREHDMALRRAEKARREDERMQVKAARANAAEQKQLAKEAREAHVRAMEAEVDERNMRLAGVYADLDTILETTLKVDDFFDLETLRIAANHPPFQSKYESSIPPPKTISTPPKPVLIEPDPPGILLSVFGRKRHAVAVEDARVAYEQALAKWHAEIKLLSNRRHAAEEAHARAEKHRIALLQIAKKKYEEECEAREAEVAERNRQLDTLIANLGYGTPEAVQEYISIVLSNSVYPDHFLVAHEFTFELSSAELSLHVTIPDPSVIPEIKAYKYTKSSDEITTTALSQKMCRDRYAGIVHQIALRSIHEVFEADRRGLIRTVRLEVGTDTVDPATGRQAYIPFVIVGVERDAFLAFDLSAIIPALTLEHMGAAVSKNPYGLVAAEPKGVRRS